MLQYSQLTQIVANEYDTLFWYITFEYEKVLQQNYSFRNGVIYSEATPSRSTGVMR